jgi:hypothetical protein
MRPATRMSHGTCPRTARCSGNMTRHATGTGLQDNTKGELRMTISTGTFAAPVGVTQVQA